MPALGPVERRIAVAPFDVGLYGRAGCSGKQWISNATSRASSTRFLRDRLRPYAISGKSWRNVREFKYCTVPSGGGAHKSHYRVETGLGSTRGFRRRPGSCGVTSGSAGGLG